MVVFYLGGSISIGYTVTTSALPDGITVSNSDRTVTIKSTKTQMITCFFIIFLLPFIGELRSLLNDNQAELEKVPDFREALEQFMFEMEEMSDYPWIELLWENEIKTRSNRVKFVFNYMNKSYCLIQYYYSNVLIGMERMNYVIEYIVNHRNDDTTQNE